MLRSREHRQERSLHRHAGTIWFFKHRPWLARTRPGREALRVAHVWLPILRRELAETRSALKPKRTLLSGTSHLAMWLCIHAKEGAWKANTGNGYYGGLQATYGWGGVARMDLLSPAAQIETAERQYAASGFSLAWLRGQWPNTSWGCV